MPNLRSILAVPVIALVAAAAPSTASAQEIPEVVFTDHRGSGRPEIAVRAPDGSVSVLTTNRAEDALAAWSPDHKWIAFASNRGNRRDDHDIYVMRRDGKQVRRLTGGRRPGSGVRELYPAWSPDGRRIAFTAQRDGREPEIHVMRADGSDRRRLTRTGRAVMNLHPRFSPDGRSIVFASSRLSFFNLEIYRMRASDGGGLTRLTFWGSGEDGALGDDAMPDYSPDGKRIAFISDRSGSNEVWTMAADGTDLRMVTDLPRSDVFFPRWSPDGGRLLYQATTGGRDVLWTARPDGTDRVRLGRGTTADW